MAMHVWMNESMVLREALAITLPLRMCREISKGQCFKEVGEHIP